MLRSLPRDMEPELAQFWILHQDLLATTLDGALIVRQPAKAAEPVLPTEMTVGGRTYEILGFLKGDEKSVPGDTMVERAKEMNANLGKEDCDFLLAHQSEIPAALRGKVVFVFTDWRSPDVRENVACLHWDDGRWVVDFYWVGDDWDGSVRLLRCK